MLTFCNSKINLGLRIVSKRPDGFHNLETIFYPVNLCDVLEVVKGTDDGTKVKIIAEGLPVDTTAADNLIARAYKLMDAIYDLEPVTFCLLKIIPMGAGLGGGSSDAAFALKLLNQLFKFNINDETLQTYAAQVGSDCAFFIKNKPAIASGRGEILRDIELNLSAYSIVLVKPPIHVSTSEAFSKVTTAESKSDLLSIIQMPMSAWSAELVNDFERSVFSVHPQLAAIKETLYQSGALYAAMSGSGSSIYGIFKSKPHLKDHFPACDYFEL